MDNLTVRSQIDRIKNNPYYKYLKNHVNGPKEEFYNRGMDKYVWPKGVGNGYSKGRYRYILERELKRINAELSFTDEYTIETSYFEFQVFVKIRLEERGPNVKIASYINVCATPKYRTYHNYFLVSELPDNLNLYDTKRFIMPEIKKRYFLDGLLEKFQHDNGYDKEKTIQYYKRFAKARMKRQEWIDKGVPDQDEYACLKSIERHLNIKAPTLDFALKWVHELGKQQEPTKIFEVSHAGLLTFDGGPDELAEEYYSRFESEPGTKILPKKDCEPLLQ